MHRKRVLTLVSALAVIMAMAGQVGPAATAAPQPPSTGSPHYFGPWPNWANSPFTLPDVQVTVTGDGIGAEATATVGANGAVTDITITNPGSGYTNASFVFSGAGGTSASATAVVTASGAVARVNVGTAGAGYDKPKVVIEPSPDGPTATATATAFGGVDHLALDVTAATPYHVPTVSFDYPDDPNGTLPTAHVECAEPNCTGTPQPDGSPGEVHVTGIVLDTPGSGYSSAPGVAILDGTQFDPYAPTLGSPAGTGAVVTSTISVDSVVMDTFGSGYAPPPAPPPSASIQETGTACDPQGAAPCTPAVLAADLEIGTVTGYVAGSLVGGSGYVTPGGIKKFTDPLPGLCDPKEVLAPPCDTNPATKQIPLAVSVEQTISGQVADTYEIGLVQYRNVFSSSMPQGALVRGYVQIDTGGVPGSQSFPLYNEWRNGAKHYIPCGDTAPCTTGQVYGVTEPSFLGPTIVASKDKAVRIVFRNLLPTGSEGDLFLPTDTTLMGSGMGPNATTPAPDDQGLVTDGVRNPMCTAGYMNMNPTGPETECFPQNRATLHLHGGVTPWISDGTPHQWITPAGEDTVYPEGVSVENVPDMNVCGPQDDGCQTFYYTNQQSARLMFYHDHAWGITRLNVYAGEAAGYLLTDGAEQGLITGNGALKDVGYGIPLVIQDRTFVPSDEQMFGIADDPNTPVDESTYGQDPTWDPARWGGPGSLWYHHVYMPAQNPGDPSGMSAFGRWMYGPWFWPPASPQHPPIDNPYYDPSCDLNDPASWTYQEDPFCEPQQIPSTPNISVGMEQFNDTPVVNGVAYPTLTVEPKSYRFRVLNAANDRFWNLQLYVADPTTASTDTNLAGQVIGGTEVALKPAELAAAQTDPVVFPTPIHDPSTDGPDWIQFGNEGGFLPAPVVVDGQQETTWITDPTRFQVGNVDLHSLLLAPAERADVVVDFSKFAGKTLILYNDAPAAFPARVPSYDYYTGAPDLRPVGAPAILPGYGPNTRTIMQIKVAGTPAAPFNVNALRSAFSHKANGSGVFESSQDPIVVGQAAYNSAYGTSFVSSGWCNDPKLKPNDLARFRCDGYARIQEGNKPTDLFGFNSLKGAFAPGVGKLQIPFQPKGLHDEMNATAFDEFGRMQANLGLEAPNANPLLQNIILYPYVNPATELVDATNLPRADVVYNTDGTVASDIKITPIASAADGTQIWKMTHNGVDTHPIHWHLWNVQVLNRVGWDNFVIPPDPAELGWKETVRVSPLEDTIVALRPIIPELPFDLPNSARPLNPMMPLNSLLGFNNVDQNGNPTPAIQNSVVNFGWEYVYHCHILSHEEMDMMRPMSVMFPPKAPTGLSATVAPAGVTLTWTDNSINETQFVIERQTNNQAWVTRGTLTQPLEQDAPTTAYGTRTFLDPGALNPNNTYRYRVRAQNVVGYGGAFMQTTLSSPYSNVAGPPIGTVTLTSLTNNANPSQNARSQTLNWTYAPDGDQTGFQVQRSTNAGFGGPNTVTSTVGNVFTSTANNLSRNTLYYWRVRAINGLGAGTWSNTMSLLTAP